MAGFRKAEPKQAAVKMSMYGPPGSGKAQPVDEPVLTPCGFVPIGSLRVCDQVIGRDGLPANVLGVYPQGEKDVFKVSFSDGTSTRCCNEHLWVVQRTHGDERWHVLPLKELRLLMEDGHGNRWGRGNKRWRIPVADAVEFAASKTLSVDPYVLGCLLGDGCFRSPGVTISSNDPSLIERIESRQPDFTFKKTKADYCWYVGNAVGKIRDLGLHGTDSGSKFIPDIYLTASLENRLEMLRGICDTDGHRTAGYADVTVKSRLLAEGVAFLARSLGFRTAVRRRKPPKFLAVAELVGQGATEQEIATKIGSTIGSVRTMRSYLKRHPKRNGDGPHEGYWRVLIACDNSNDLFTLKRKNGAKRQGKYLPARMKVIAGIEPCGQSECVCIAVDSEDRTYLTRDFIVTHNTFTALLFAEGIAKITGKRIAYNDTERGTDFYTMKVPDRHPHPEAFDFDALYTRSLTEVLKECKKLDPKEYGVIIIDSISHLWDTAIAAYSGPKTGKGGIPMHAWGNIKRPYKELMRFLIDSPFHVFILGRQSNVFEDDDGEVKAAGVKMRAEGETAYEPHICLRMAPQRTEKKGNKIHVHKQQVIAAFAEKDRSGILSGKLIEWPDFSGVIAPLLGLLSGEQAQTPSDEEAASQDAEAIAQAERDKAANSLKLAEDYKARFQLAKDAAELKAIGNELTPAVKKQFSALHLAELQVAYRNKDNVFKGKSNGHHPEPVQEEVEA